jgi:peptide/nickel transport system substrate-binding protein
LVNESDRAGTQGAARERRLEPGAGSRAWFGWPDVPQLDKLVTDRVRTTDQTKRLQLGDEIQKLALSEVTYVPWGEWVQPTAFRKNVKDVLKFGAPIFWNVKVNS